MRLAANLVWKTLSASLEKASRLALVFVSAPLLGSERFGRFQLATTVTTILALATELGLGLWTTRALARSRERQGVIVVTTLRIRLLAVLPYAVVTAIAAAVLGGEAGSATLIAGVSSMASAYVDHFAAILRGQERFAAEARLNLTRALLVLALGLGAVAHEPSLLALMLGITVGTAAAAGYGRALIGWPPATYDPTLARTAIAESRPIWLAGLLSLLYFKVDTVLVRWLAGDAELGSYAAAYKLFEGSQLLPAIVMAATFPLLARGDERRRWEWRIGGALLGLGLIVGLTLHVGRHPIIDLLYGDGFSRAVPSLAVLALAVPLMFLNCGLTHFLIARDLARRNMAFAGALLVLNIAVNVIVIPRWGAPGAAWATVATEATLSALCLAVLAL